MKQMNKKPTFFLALAVFLLVTKSTMVLAEPEIKVVTTLSTFADLVEQIGASHVSVDSIASPRFDPHFIEPRPTDVLRVKRANLFVHAGLDLELWREALVNAAGNPDVKPGGAGELDLSLGITLREVPTRALTRADGDVHLYGNPHYWLDPRNAKKMVTSIAEKLSQIDPSNKSEYEQNLAVFLDKLDSQIATWKSLMASHAGKEIVGFHNSWAYLMNFAGLSMDNFLQPKPGIAPTPKQLQLLTKLMQKDKIKVIVQESFHPSRPAESLAERTGATILLLCQNVGEQEGCSDYISTIDYNLKKLAGAL